MPSLDLSDKKLQDLLFHTVLKIPADYAEIRAESSESTIISFKGKDPSAITQPDALGFFVRVLIDGSWGIAAFNDIKLLKSKINQALGFAKLQGKGKVVLAETPISQAEVLMDMKKDFRKIPLSKKVALTKHYNQLMLNTSKDIQSTD
ncbi:hypothetical protein HY389_01025, partial [Candidatus Daviesbacteria bacterium]|nr:hypothetical protein [Candidatus Daviesbacteria bacterium]